MEYTMYRKPGFLTRRVLTPAGCFLTATLGIGLKGSRVLAVQGRKTGEWHSVPVNPLTIDGRRYLVSPRGTTQWVRNVRLAHEARLTFRRKTEVIGVEEVPDAEKPPILRAYLKNWAWEVGQFFGGVGASASEDELLRIAPDHPVFLIVEG
jgi:deazaflavin-dependent oxidoreductase (nitroreductase family)